MNLETINKWLDEEYGCSYTKLEELHNFYFEKYCDLKQENERLKEEIEEYKNPIKYFKYANKNVTDKNKKLNGTIQTYDILLKSNIEENKQLKDKLSKIETLIINHNCDTGDIYYKYNSKFLKSELKQRILEIVCKEGSDSNVKD